MKQAASRHNGSLSHVEVLIAESIVGLIAGRLIADSSAGIGCTTRDCSKSMPADLSTRTGGRSTGVSAVDKLSVQDVVYAVCQAHQ